MHDHARPAKSPFLQSKTRPPTRCFAARPRSASQRSRVAPRTARIAKPHRRTRLLFYRRPQQTHPPPAGSRQRDTLTSIDWRSLRLLLLPAPLLSSSPPRLLAQPPWTTESARSTLVTTSPRYERSGCPCAICICHVPSPRLPPAATIAAAPRTHDEDSGPTTPSRRARPPLPPRRTSRRQRRARRSSRSWCRMSWRAPSSVPKAPPSIR